MNSLNISEQIRILEELLLHQDFTVSPDSLEAMLADNFREVSANGTLTSRESVKQWLLQKDQSERWLFSDFEVQLLSPGLAQATYHARKISPKRASSRGAIHISLWQHNKTEKRWQLLFHQSTRVS